MAEAKRKGKKEKEKEKENEKEASPPKPTAGDVMEKKHYYDALTKTVEELHTKRGKVHEEIEAEEAEKKKLEQMIMAMQQWLEKAEPSLELKKERLAKMDRNLLELTGGNLTPRSLARRMRFANLPSDPIQRAAILRDEFSQMIAENAEPEEPSMHISATPRGLGIEAVSVRDVHATCSHGVTVPIRCYSSSTAESDPPAIVFFHGGGYVLGDVDTHNWLCRSLSSLSGATVASVHYRRPPEHQFPAAAVDAYEALQWVASGGLGFMPRKVAVAGDCSGGGLAAGCCLTARDDPRGPAIAMQILAYPWLDLRPEAPAVNGELRDGRYGLSGDELDWYREVYAPPGSDHNGGGEWVQDPRASPLIAESLSGLPRTFLAYAVKDVLASESLSFAERLRSELGPAAVHTMRLEGPQHHFLAMGNAPESHAVLSAAAAYASAMLWVP